MAVLRPLNDEECLELLHKEAARLRRTGRARRIARRFRSVGHLVGYIRRCKQRDDLGEGWDGPRLPCRISQRSRFAPSDPNCFERTLFFLTIAPLINPSRDMSSASMMVNEGWHTFPVQFRNGLPKVVVLDPLTAPPLNTMSAAAYQGRNANPETRANIVHWFDDTARNACLEQGAEERYDRAIDSLRNSLASGQSIEHLEDMAYVLALTAEDAKLWGPRGQAAFNRVHNSIRNLSFNLDINRVGKFVEGLAKHAEAIGPKAIKAALISQYGPAAGIALQGMNLVLDDGKGKTAPSKGTSTTKPETKTATATKNVTVAPQPDQSGTDESDTKDTKKQLTPLQRLRRMTLAFR